MRIERGLTIVLNDDIFYTVYALSIKNITHKDTDNKQESRALYCDSFALFYY